MQKFDNIRYLSKQIKFCETVVGDRNLHFTHEGTTGLATPTGFIPLDVIYSGMYNSKAEMDHLIQINELSGNEFEDYHKQKDFEENELAYEGLAEELKTILTEMYKDEDVRKAIEVFTKTLKKCDREGFAVSFYSSIALITEAKYPQFLSKASTRSLTRVYVAMCGYSEDIRNDIHKLFNKTQGAHDDAKLRGFNAVNQELYRKTLVETEFKNLKSLLDSSSSPSASEESKISSKVSNSSHYIKSVWEEVPVDKCAFKTFTEVNLEASSDSSEQNPKSDPLTHFDSRYIESPFSGEENIVGHCVLDCVLEFTKSMTPTFIRKVRRMFQPLVSDGGIMRHIAHFILSSLNINYRCRLDARYKMNVTFTKESKINGLSHMITSGKVIPVLPMNRVSRVIQLANQLKNLGHVMFGGKMYPCSQSYLMDQEIKAYKSSDREYYSMESHGKVALTTDEYSMYRGQYHRCIPLKEVPKDICCCCDLIQGKVPFWKTHNKFVNQGASLAPKKTVGTFYDRMSTVCTYTNVRLNYVPRIGSRPSFLKTYISDLKKFDNDDEFITAAKNSDIKSWKLISKEITKKISEYYANLNSSTDSSDQEEETKVERKPAKLTEVKLDLDSDKEEEKREEPTSDVESPRGTEIRGMESDGSADDDIRDDVSIMSHSTVYSKKMVHDRGIKPTNSQISTIYDEIGSHLNYNRFLRLDGKQLKMSTKKGTAREILDKYKNYIDDMSSANWKMLKPIAEANPVCLNYNLFELMMEKYKNNTPLLINVSSGAGVNMIAYRTWSKLTNIAFNQCDLLKSKDKKSVYIDCEFVV